MFAVGVLGLRVRVGKVTTTQNCTKTGDFGTVVFESPFPANFRHRQVDHWLDATANLCKIVGHAIGGFFLSVPAFHEC
jgi:hypothetical protein